MKSIQMRGIVAAVSGALLLGAAPMALADSTDDIINALMAKGVLTEEEGALLMKGRTGEKEAAEAKKASEVKASFKDGLVFESGDKSFKATINGRVHTDYRWFDYEEDDVRNTAGLPTRAAIDNSGGADTFDVRRARLGMKVNFKEYYEAEVVGDFSSTARLDVGYLNIAWWKPVQFRFGQFKMPMNLEELTSSNNIDFIERSYVNSLAPAKEVGAMVHGAPFKGITYALAASNGEGQNGTETDMREDGKDIIGRVTANFAEMMDKKDMVLHIGASLSDGELKSGSTIGVNGRTEARGATFFRAPVGVDSNTGTAFDRSIDRKRAGVEAAVAYGPFKAQAEWMRANYELDTSATRSYDMDIKNWYAEVLWLVTGENYADFYKNGVWGGIKPKNDFDPTFKKGGRGAWEIGLRYSKFDASDFASEVVNMAADSGIAAASGSNCSTTSRKMCGFAEADAWTLGIKFLPTANTRLMLNYVKTDFEEAVDGANGGLAVNGKNEDSEDAIILRAQWMF